MRPTSSTMLQQNNNNNYPCLNVSASTREMLQKCSRSSLPFPSRLELGLGDLPLIKGLRTWALCSKNRRKAFGLLGGGQAPTAPPAGRGSSSSCPRPADVYLSEEWGRLGYGLPLDNRQTGIGALVTVATLKTSEGGGKTQTQCLFLRTEKGSCLYSTAKPGPGLTSTVVGGWLRGKTGGGGRDCPAGRRDNGTPLPAQTGANRVRVRSGRRWRKSGNAAERAGLKQQRSREEATGETTLEERQEERDKGGFPVDSLDSRRFPSPQQDSKQAPQERDGAFRSPRCCHNTSAEPCARCGRRAQRRDNQEDREGGESPINVPNGLNNEVKGMRKERHKKAVDEEEDSVLAVPNPDLETNSFYPESQSGCMAEERKVTESSEAQKKQTSHSKDVYSSKEGDANSQTAVMKTHTGSGDFIDGPSDGRNRDTAKTARARGETEANGISEHETLDQQSEQEILERVNDEEEEGFFTQTPDQLPVRSVCYERAGVCLSAFPASFSASVSLSKAPEPSTPAEGNTRTAEHESCGDQGEQGSSRKDNKHRGIREHLERDEEEVDAKLQQLNSTGVNEIFKEPACELYTDASDEDQSCCNQQRKLLFFIKKEEEDGQQQERKASSSPPLLFERIVTDKSGNCVATEPSGATDGEQREESTRERGEEASEEEKLKPEEGDKVEEVWKEEHTCKGEGSDNEEEWCADGKRDEVTKDSAVFELYGERSGEDVEKTCVPRVDWWLREPTEEVKSERECISDQPGPLVEERRTERGWKVEEDRETCEETTITTADVSRVENGETSSPLPPSPATTTTANVAVTSGTLSSANPAPPLRPPGAMATDLPRLEVEGVRAEAGEYEQGSSGKRGQEREPASPEEDRSEAARGCTVAAERAREDEEEEDEFGVFMQAEGEPAWSEALTMSASVPRGSRESSALGNHAIARESPHWTSGWTDSSFQQSEDSWTAFPQHPLDKSGDKVGQWWPTSAVEERTDRGSANQNLAAVFSEAFPSLSGPSCDPRDPDTVPTLAQLLRSNQQLSRGSQDPGLLDSFHDLNRMIGQRYKRANGVCRDLLLKTLHLEKIHTENRTGPLTASRRLSPGLPSANQHAQNAAAKRRLSHDYNRNMME